MLGPRKASFQMKQQISDADLKEAQNLFEKACALTKGELILHDNQGRKPPGFWKKLQLKRAAKLLERVLLLAPNHWNSMWILGKTVQRLGNEKAAFEWFVKAWDQKPKNVNVAREAALSAMHLGLSRHAIGYCEEAVKLEPNNSGLVSNLALSLLHDGRPEQALVMAERAFAMDANDKVNENVLRIIKHIATTKSPCPKNGEELNAYCKNHKDIFR